MQAGAKLSAAIPDLKLISNLSFPTIAAEGNYIIEACFTVLGQEGFSYMPAVEVSSFDEAGPEFTVTIPAGKYAVFTYNGPASAGTVAFRRSVVKNYWPTAPYKRLNAPPRGRQFGLQSRRRLGELRSSGHEPGLLGRRPSE